MSDLWSLWPEVPKVGKPRASDPFEFSGFIPDGGYKWVYGRLPEDADLPRWLDDVNEDATAFTKLREDPEWAMVAVREENVHLQFAKERWSQPYASDRDTAPLRENPSLFREFIGVDGGDREAVLGFTNKYGLLRANAMPVFPAPMSEGHLSLIPEKHFEFAELFLAGRASLRWRTVREPREAGDHEPDDVKWVIEQAIAAAGESDPLSDFIYFPFQIKGAVSHDDWRLDQEELADAVETWDLVGRADSKGLSSRYVVMASAARPGESAVRRRKSPPAWEWRRCSEDGTECGATIRRSRPPQPGDVFGVATEDVCDTINRNLYKRVQTSLATDPVTGGVVLRSFPEDLLTAMWMQFAHTVAVNKDHKMCKGCGKWFTVPADQDARTARREFCGEACKSRDYRRRKEQKTALDDQADRTVE